METSPLISFPLTRVTQMRLKCVHYGILWSFSVHCMVHIVFFFFSSLLVWLLIRALLLLYRPLLGSNAAEIFIRMTGLYDL